MNATDQTRAELLRSLGKVVRGLSALFWGLPSTLLIYVQTSRTDWFDALGWAAMLPPVVITAVLFYGLTQMHSFQRQERIWIRALDRAQIVSFINIGLSPFLYWWHQLPSVGVYNFAITLLACSSILFLFNLNYVLQRLTAMLPDETLRIETRMFTSFNRALLAALPAIVAIYFVLLEVEYVSPFISRLIEVGQRLGVWLVLFLLLMPLAMTMTLIWKIKEVIFASLFESAKD